MKMQKILSALTAAALLATAAPTVALGAPEEAENAAESYVQETTVEAAATLPYQDTSLSFEERAADLVARMTLAEKATQTAGKGGNAVSRLGVSGYNYWREGIHGVARQGGATSFPSSLAMSNTWDRNLMFEVMDITSTEARAKNPRYNLNYWNPTINMARDPRWGRNEESYGEDPYLTTEIGGNAIKGMQGTDEKYLKTMATLKHYAANNCEGERQTGTSVMNEKTMREYYTRAFRDISEDYNPAAVMSSYNGSTVYRNGEILSSTTGQKIDYVASSANSYLLNDLLRRVYGFDGFVVGDCGAWDNAFGRAPLRRKLYPDANLDDITAPMTVAKIIQAGSSLDCNSGNNGTGQVLTAVNEGLITEDELDVMVYELFLARMKTGEFDSGAKYQDIKSSALETEESNQKALEAAESSWVMLENRNNMLPLDNTVNNVAVVGAYANDVILGDYSADKSEMKQAHLVKPIDGITDEIKAINPNATVNLIGNVSESTPLFNMKSVKLVKGSKEEALDLSKATTVIGAKKDGSQINGVTPAATIVIPSVNFKDVTDISIEAASYTGMPNVTVAIGYGSASQNAANVKINPTADENTYAVNKDVYNGATGGYTETRDMYITITASTEFSVENFKGSLDEADIIIAYAGTTEADSGESNDRKSIDLPSSQGHVQKICDAYPEKTIVAMQTVGQVNVEGFKDKCAAMLWTSYNGQQQGAALGRILTGKANPSGKLSTTWYTQADLAKMPIGSARTKIDGIDYNFTNYELDKDINNAEADFPGRTYQYYTGTPVYPFGYGKSYSNFEYSNVKVSKAAADANDVIQITADITNTGSVKGAEAAQLYIAAPGAGTNGMPIKQLKNFEKVEIGAGEKQTVTFDLDISDVYFYDEAAQKNYVSQGEYTAYVGTSSADTANSVKFTVSGEIAETIKNVYAIPSGITLYIATDSAKAHPDEPGNSIDAGVSVTLKDDTLVTDFAAKGITLKYTSSNPEVAVVDENGMVKAGAKTGVATITVTASKAGSADAVTSFPVVTETKERIKDDVKAGYLKQLDDTYGSCVEISYTAENWQAINDIYNEARAFVSAAILDDNVKSTVDNALAKINAVPKIVLEELYDVVSVNPAVMQDGVIDYDPSGIGSYTAGATNVSGTITENSPCIIDFKAIDNGNAISDSLVWSVKRIDGSSRKSASIDVSTGKLTLYENGVYEILAANYPAGKGGKVIVNANLQIEGESADAANGAKLDDAKDGTSGGLCAGSTSNKWIRYDGVKLENLADIAMRVSQKDAESQLKVSMTPNDDWIIAEGTAPVTGAWTNWTDVKMAVNDKVLDTLTFDENGCTSIYVQTNGANLDYMRLAYNSGSLKVTNIDGGKMSVETPAELSGATLVGAVYNDDGTLKKVATGVVSGDVTELGGLEEHDRATIYTWNNLNAISPISGKTTKVYNAAQTDKKKFMFNFSESNFDSFFNTAENTLQHSNLGMDNYGGWATGGGGSYKLDGVTYTFTRSLKGGKGDAMARKVFFTPAYDGVVTAFFNASPDRVMKIEQGGEVLNEKNGAGKVDIVQANVKGGTPVYVYGGGSNKELHGVLFEADKTVEVIKPTPTPTPTPIPTYEPIPDDQVMATVPIQFENYTKAFDSGFKPEDLADGNKCIGSTGNDYIFYFGEQPMDNLGEIDLVAAQRESGGVATATFYAVDVAGQDVSAMSKANASKLLTDANKLGTVELIRNPSSWADYHDNAIRFTQENAPSGTKGLFVKLGTSGKYAGNHDKIVLTYLKPAASGASELAAENSNAVVSIAGDVITAVNKYSGEITTMSYSSEYGSRVNFSKLINTNGMLTALITDTDSGKTGIITSPDGTVWMDITPVEFAENDLGSAEYKINDILSVNDQMFLGCDGGVLITMPPCSKCMTLKKVCDFDITSLDCADGIITLCGDGESMDISLSDARQSDIQKEAAYELINSGAELVDVRTAKEYESGSIDGSVNVPIDEFEAWISTQDSSKTVIVFCGTGSRAEKAVETAQNMGFDNIYTAGGIDNLK